MARARRAAVWILGGLTGLVLLGLAGVLVLTNTGWGREQVRGLVVGQLNETIDGELRIERIDGNLLGAPQLVGVSVVDAEGRPFLEAERATIGFALLPLLRERVLLTAIELEGTHVVLDELPGHGWNFGRIFGVDDEPEPEPEPGPGWGSWIEIRNVELDDVRVTVRMDWRPGDDLSEAERAEKVRGALAGETMERVEEVSGGFQQVMDFRDLHGRLPRILVAHPDTVGIPVEVAGLSGVAEPFRASPGIIEELSGHLRVGEESLGFQDARLVMPGSTLTGEAVLGLDDGDVVAGLEARPVTVADFRFLQPDLPEGIRGDVRLGLTVRSGVTQLVAEDLDAAVGEGSVAGRVDVTLGETYRIGETDLAIEAVRTRFLSEVFPALELERHGELSGQITARPAAGVAAPADAGTGIPAEDNPVELDVSLRFDDEAGGSSRIFVAGVAAPAPDDPRVEALTVRLDPLAATAIEAFVPRAPIRGTIEGFVTLDGSLTRRLGLRSELTHRDPVAGASRMSAEGAVDLRDELRFVDLRVALDEVALALARDQAEHVPPDARVSGTVFLDGPPSGMLRVESDLVLDDPATGISRITTRGEVSPTGGPAFRLFEVAFDPIRLGLAEAVAGELPVGGAVAGTVRLDGAPEAGLAFLAELVHEDPGAAPVAAEPGAEPPSREAPSRIAAEGALRTADEGFVTIEVELDGVSLHTVGLFAPEAELRGRASGRIEAEGSLRELDFRAALELPGEGRVESEGRVDVASEVPSYDVAMRLARVNLAALSGRVEESTAITGQLRATGEGAELESARARLEVDLADEEDPDARAVFADLALVDGLLRVDSLAVEFLSARARAEGSFGLVAGRSGELRYAVEVDSLQAFTRYLEPDPDAVVQPRPAVHEAAVERRRQELLDAARAARVEYLATGEQPQLLAAADTVGLVPLRRGAMAGSVRATGTLEGNLEAVDVEGDLTVEDVVAMGHHVEWATAGYSLLGVGGARPVAALDVRARELLVAGFGYERVVLQASYRGDDLRANGVEREGILPARHFADASFVLYQDDLTRIRAAVTAEISDEAGEVRLDELVLHVPNATYRTPGAALVRWSPDELEIRDLVLESDFGALVRADGLLPRDPAAGRPGELDLRIRDLEIEHLMILAQQGEGTTGRLSLEAPVRGTLADPVFEGEATVTLLTMDARGLPDARVSVAYADREVSAEALLLAVTGEPMLQAEARLPVDLSLVDAPDPRLLDGPIRLDVRIDDLALEDLPALTDQVESIVGRADGHLTVSGTFDQPEAEGALEIDIPTMYVVPLGVRLGNVAASLTFADEVLRVDSLVAWSRGPVRMSGEVALLRGEAPTLDLVVEARNSQVMDTEDVQMRVDADLEVQGPYEAIEVTGTVRTRRGVIRIPEAEELAAAGPLDLEDPAVLERVDPRFVAARDALIDRDPVLQNLRLEVDLYVDRDTWIRSTEANIAVFTPPEVGPLRVRMHGIAARDLSLEGTINTDRGEYAFMGRRFDLARGSVTFGPETRIDPLIRLTAEHEVQMPAREAFDIRIILDGTLAELDTELESTAQPPISQTDLLSFVVFGRDAGSLLQHQGSALMGQASAGGPLVGAVAARAAQQFATVGFQAVVTEVETETARALGLDVLHIQPADLPAEISTGEFIDVLRGTEIEAGAYVTPRLFLSGQARPTFVHPGALLEYQTEHGWVWRATWRPRYLPAVPTLSQEAPGRASVLGSLLFREWRF